MFRRRAQCKMASPRCSELALPCRRSRRCCSGCLTAPLSAQKRGIALPHDANADRSVALQNLDRLADRGPKVKDDRAKAEKANRDFMEHLADFATAWNALMKVHETGVWSTRQARQAHKAFERLVRSQGRPGKQQRLRPATLGSSTPAPASRRRPTLLGTVRIHRGLSGRPAASVPSSAPAVMALMADERDQGAAAGPLLAVHRDLVR